MVEAISSTFRATLALLGVFALADPASSSPLVAVAVAVAVALLVALLVAASPRTRSRGSAVHPTRRSELTAPLTQSDPAAAGHVRRRGPGQVTAAA